MKVIFMGSPAFAVPALQNLVSNVYDIAAVYTQPDKKTGRGQQLMSCPVKQYAESIGLNVLQPVSFKDPDVVAVLANMEPDIIIVAACGLILPDAVLQIPKYKCINIHPSLLPRYRGPSPIAAAILSGDAITGVTIMLIEKKVDSGPILSQRAIPIADEDTTETLSRKLAEMGAEMLTTTIPDWAEGKIQPRVQNEGLASYTRMETKEDGRLDWNLPAVQLWRRVRAYYPWPGCFTAWKSGRLKVLKAISLPDPGSGSPGQVMELGRTEPARVAVRTGDGLLGLITVQAEGKKEMAAADFIAGHRDFIGAVL
jgi:methionyl-tRNA formyltransferase